MRARLLRVAAMAAALVVMLPRATARAQDPGEVPSTAADMGPPSTIDVAGKLPYWSSGEPRAFVAATLEAGLVYYRPTLMLGLGEPHWRWLGIETQARISAGSGSEYAGLRFALPNAELRVGARYVFASNQDFLRRRAIYTDDTLELEQGPSAKYVGLEAETSGALPVGDGAFFGTLGVFHMLGVPARYDAYDQLLHVVVEPPWALRQRGGYVHGFGDDKGLKIGAAAELIEVPEREAVVFRLGPQLGVSLTHHLDAVMSIMAVVASPDSLRLEGTDIGQFGFRYRWATGDRFPEFP